MATTSNIEWTEKTWNPVVGCSMCSPGCAQCYAERMSKRLAAMARADLAKGRDPGRKRHYLNVINDKGRFNGVLEPVPEALTAPLAWTKPATVFVNSMSDLFHEKVPFAFVDRVFATMALCPQHTFQVLTKRPERMAEYFMSFDRYAAIQNIVDDSETWDDSPIPTDESAPLISLPLPNVWLGCSPVDQATADAYVPHLLRTPAAVRFLSIEPMLGAIDLLRVNASGFGGHADHKVDCIRKGYWSTNWGFVNHSDMHATYGPLHWVILGCESLPGGRVGRNAEHVNGQMAAVVGQCRAAGVPVFVKQVNVAGRVEHDLAKFPEALRVREYPARVGTVAA